MPTLDGAAKTAYESAHRHDTLRKYEDSEDQVHGGELMHRQEIRRILAANGSPDSRFFHQPRHDAESVFWVIVVFLLRVRPVDENVEKRENQDHETEVENPALNDLWKPLAEHDIGGRNDNRGNILKATTKTWVDALHPKLAFLEPMIGKLAEQVRPEYSLISPMPPALHLHEAMQRILFQTIWSMRDADPIPLDGGFRMVTINRVVLRVHSFQPFSGTRRGRTDEEEAPHRKSKSKPTFFVCTNDGHLTLLLQKSGMRRPRAKTSVPYMWRRWCALFHFSMSTPHAGNGDATLFR
jgi:hypothetical protein